MKAKLLYAILAMAGTVGFVVFQVGFAGDKHVTVVKENISLFNENNALREENADLKEENAALEAIAGGQLDRDRHHPSRDAAKSRALFCHFKHQGHHRTWQAGGTKQW